MRKLVEHRENFGARAPVTEALIDIRATLPHPVAAQTLRAFGEGLEGYPRIRTQTQGQIRMEASGVGSSVTSSHGVRGFMYLDESEKQIAQVRIDGFTFSRVHPYESWEDLRDEARRLWHRYTEIAQPESVTRIAVRYINRLEFEEDPVTLGKWLKLNMVTPLELGPMADFLLRMVVQHPDEPSYVGTVTQGTAQPTIKGRANAIVLDIDCWTSRTCDPAGDDIWRILEDLREFKNDFFFGTMTDEALRRIADGSIGPS